MALAVILLLQENGKLKKKIQYGNELRKGSRAGEKHELKAWFILIEVVFMITYFTIAYNA